MFTFMETSLKVKTSWLAVQANHSRMLAWATLKVTLSLPLLSWKYSQAENSILQLVLGYFPRYRVKYSCGS